jgi:transposase-like protein
MATCPNCQSCSCTKAGIVRIKQGYKCKTCRYFFTDPASHSRAIKQQALAMVLDGNAIRQAATYTGVILYWIKQAAQATEYNLLKKQT